MMHVVFRVGDADYVLPATEVLQMESYQGATPVPGAASHVAGLMQVRGRVVPVIDLRMRFGLPAVAAALDHRVVVVERGARVVGLLCDSAREIVTLQPGELSDPPDVVSRDSRGFVAKVAHSGPRLFLLLDFSKVIGEEPSDGG